MQLCFLETIDFSIQIHVTSRQVTIMTRHASPSEIIGNRTDLGQGGAVASASASGHLYLSEPELSAWAEQSTMASNGRSRFGHLGTLAFWTIVAGLLIARFFVVDPATLRPHDTSISASSAAPSKI